MKNRRSTILTVLVVVALFLGAVCIGGVKNFKEEREKLLLSCMEMHISAGTNLTRSIKNCEEDAADFDARLKYTMMGKVAGTFGVTPVSSNVVALHAQLVREQNTVTGTPGLLEQFGERIGELLEDNIDTKLSLGKIFWTMILLTSIFGKKARKRGFTLRKLLAGFGLFRLWRKR